MINNANATWAMIMGAEKIKIQGFHMDYEGEKLEEILNYLEVIPQEEESLYIPILKDGEYKITALTTVVKSYEYNPEIDDLEEVTEEIELTKKFVVSNERLYRDDKLAVIISPHYGAGWYTWLQDPKFLLHPLLVKRVEEEIPITREWLEETLHVDLEGFSDEMLDQHLVIRWVPRGCSFIVDEYDGAESIKYFNPDNYIMA